jgi:hypothetical protein
MDSVGLSPVHSLGRHPASFGKLIRASGVGITWDTCTREEPDLQIGTVGGSVKAIRKKRLAGFCQLLSFLKGYEVEVSLLNIKLRFWTNQ